jgi:hypothetical protein
LLCQVLTDAANRYNALVAADTPAEGSVAEQPAEQPQMAEAQ